ncbi:MAG: pyruvate ferredoxin oxidoreductase [Candidatus Buchananbacteria bacterium RBG_13_39_9]|uniref:Pyruvate ferredoxin oxidoreductase n=1 Tax=Candidatus Buchananbacteria bacterium RBG_13_39_9 TaxID=1797531 RepID=A0A1G1XRV0_9BACT|nr:MAG: pyruvate ferredoxin oxidoreductase [Candidatus Buchananbacteria bacterium RBG_13_39_9]
MKQNNKQILEGSHAVAEIVKNLRPAVVAAYPITPQTHIVEDLAKMKDNGEADFEYINAESEFSAASIVLGASATGVRTYTATSSQGLLLMTEVLFNIAGLRLPVVITCANRAISSPINIWNDQQDSVTIRDAGWLQLYAETNQEAVDLHILAYKLAESLMIPVMVNMDGFVLTHTFESVEIPDETLIKRFLPDYVPPKDTILDTANPRSLGTFAAPDRYMEIRQELFKDVAASINEIVKQNSEFKKVFGRGVGNGLIEEYKTKDAEIILVAMGSACGTIKEVIDKLRAKGAKVGLLKIISFRPFPDEEIATVLSKTKYIGVIDKSISIGTEGILASDIKRACYGKLKAPIKSFIVGLGGRDVTEKMIGDIVEMVKGNAKETGFVGS